MGSILTPAIDAIRKIAPEPALRTWHGPDSGECPNTLDTLPVHLRYELIDDFHGGEVAEVVAVSICGHSIDAGDFSNDIRAEWARQCMAARVAAGWQA